MKNKKTTGKLTYIDAVNAFAKTTYKSIYIINYQKKSFEYVSTNPLFLCGHHAEDVKKMGFIFYSNQVPCEDLELLYKVKHLALTFFYNTPIEERKKLTMAYDYHLHSAKNSTILIHQEITPLSLTAKGKLKKVLCIVSISTAKKAGNITLQKEDNLQLWSYNLTTEKWEIKVKTHLTQRELEILQFSARGYTINAIALFLFIAPNTIKFHRKKLFEKLGVSSMAEAIRLSIVQKLL